MKAFCAWKLKGCFRALNFAAVVLMAEIAATCVALASPGCIGDVENSASNTDYADNCQYKFDISGSTYASMNNVAPPACPAGTTCVAGSSNGIIQYQNVSNILYNSYGYGGPTSNQGYCRFVDVNSTTNQNEIGLFVPQGSPTEFQDFIKGAPSNVALAFCTTGTATYTATATYPNGYELWNNAGVASSWGTNGVASYVSSTNVYAPPITRVGYSYTMPSVPLSYSREDCVKDAAGTTLCRLRAIVETQSIQFQSAANSNARCQANSLYVPSGANGNCDGYWSGGLKKSSSYTIDGVPYSSALADYDPPTISGCGTEADGATWTSTAAGTAVTGACPAGYTGTQSCPTTVTSTYTCNDGTNILDSSSTAEGTCSGCAAITAAPPTTCTSTTFGSDCDAASVTSNEAHASLYQLTPIPDPTRGGISNVGKYAGQRVDGDVDLITADDIIPNTSFYASTIDIPDQLWTNGFPRYPNLTEWFGLCYDAGFNAPTSGNYTFVVEVDDGVAMWIDGKFIFDDEDGDVSTKKPMVFNDTLVSASGISTIPPVYLTAGLHSVRIEYYQGWPSALGLAIWALPPGQTFQETCWPEAAPSPGPGGIYSGCPTPPASDLMQLVGPPNGALTCPGN